MELLSKFDLVLGSVGFVCRLSSFVDMSECDNINEVLADVGTVLVLICPLLLVLVIICFWWF